MNDKEKIEAIEKEISLVYDDLESFKKEPDYKGQKFIEIMKEEWKVLYHIHEILKK